MQTTKSTAESLAYFVLCYILFQFFNFQESKQLKERNK